MMCLSCGQPISQPREGQVVHTRCDEHAKPVLRLPPADKRSQTKQEIRLELASLDTNTRGKVAGELGWAGVMDWLDGAA